MRGSFWELLEDNKKNMWPVCIYGLGRIANRCIDDIVRVLDIKVDYYCDKNHNAVESFELKSGRQLPFAELINNKTDILVIILVGNASIASACECLRVNDFLHLITFEEIASDTKFLRGFFGLDYLPEVKNYYNNRKFSCVTSDGYQLNSNKTVAIYTCITNSYDTIPNILYTESDADYYLITDEKYEDDIVNGFRVMNVDSFVPEYITNPQDVNRYCKSHGALIFKEYDYSIYFDGNIDIVGPISECVLLAQKSGLALHKHPYVNDAYHELFRVYAANRISKSDAIKTAKWLSSEGYPRKVLCLDCNVIVCDNNNLKAVNVLAEWFQLYMKGAAKRDQIYMSYLLWRQGMDEDSIGIIGGTVDGDDGYVLRRCSHIP